MHRGTQELVVIHNFQAPKSWAEYTTCVDIKSQNVKYIYNTVQTDRQTDRQKEPKVIKNAPKTAKT